MRALRVLLSEIADIIAPDRLIERDRDNQRELVRVGVEEIERLRADNQRLTDEIEQLRLDMDASFALIVQLNQLIGGPMRELFEDDQHVEGLD